MSQTIAVFSQNPGGNKSLLNITAAVAVKASPGVLYTLSIVAGGSGSVLTLNDCATTGAAAAANEIATFTNTQLTALLSANAPLIFNWPCLVGLVVSSITTGGVVAIAYA